MRRTTRRWQPLLMLRGMTDTTRYRSIVLVKQLFVQVNTTQIKLYYVSEGHVLTSSSYLFGAWSPGLDSSLENYSTALNTRSLSVASTGSPLNATVNSTSSALLYYESPSGNISALLQQGDRWVDITSQDSKLLPSEFRNTPTSTQYQGGHTLYESEIYGTLSTPFACGANWTSTAGIGAIFYSPYASFSVANSSTESRFVVNHYGSASDGPGNFTSRMKLRSSYSATG